MLLAGVRVHEHWLGWEWGFLKILKIFFTSESTLTNVSFVLTWLLEKDVLTYRLSLELPLL